MDYMKEKSGGEGNRWLIALLLALAFLFALVSAAAWNLRGDSPLLINEKGAQWIRFPEPFRLRIHFAKTITTSFRSPVKVPIINEKAVLTFRSAGEAKVFLDKKAVFFSPSSGIKRPKEKHRVDLSPFLEPGNHELRIVVSNAEGHPLLIAYSENLGLFTGENWEASKDGLHWLPAVSADKTYRLAISRTLPRLGGSISSLALFYISVFLLFFFWSISAAKPVQRTWSIKPLNAGAVRWFVMLAWLVMAINNFWKLPLEMGMDFKGHMQYILHLAENRRIPLATEGWQMFQQPLYYLLTSGLYGFLHLFFSDETSIRAIKLFSVFCGMLQIEISYRMIKLLYPSKESIQGFGVVFAGFIPMNLYMSQSLGNEPLAGLLTALTILTAVKLALNDTAADREKSLLMGFLLGLALLTKVSTVLIVLPLLFFISAEIIIKKGFVWLSAKSAAGFMAIVLLVAFSVSGWYYFKNYIEMGSFFVGGWDLSRDIVWWQDPGYRTLRQLYFSASLYTILLFLRYTDSGTPSTPPSGRTAF